MLYGPYLSRASQGFACPLCLLAIERRGWMANKSSWGDFNKHNGNELAYYKNVFLQPSVATSSLERK
jgi:hypothetical protein